MPQGLLLASVAPLVHVRSAKTAEHSLELLLWIHRGRAGRLLRARGELCVRSGGRLGRPPAACAATGAAGRARGDRLRVRGDIELQVKAREPRAMTLQGALAVAKDRHPR